MRVRARRTAVVIGVLAAVATVAGCSTGPDVVAEVEGTTITEADLDRVVTELGPLLADSSRGAVLSAIVQSTAGLQLGELNDIEVSDDRAAEFLDSLATNIGAEPSDWSDGSLTIARMQLLGQDLSQLPDADAATDQYEEILANLDITVSPRYGQYDPVTGTIVALDPEWIVSPESDEQAVAE
jgi:hypothetical protein